MFKKKNPLPTSLKLFKKIKLVICPRLTVMSVLSCGLKAVRSSSILLSCGLKAVRSSSILQSCGLKALRSSSILLSCGLKAVRSSSILLQSTYLKNIRNSICTPTKGFPKLSKAFRYNFHIIRGWYLRLYFPTDFTQASRKKISRQT